ncbi:MAG: AAA family ATPase, partial [Alphaproteobacteria bacterium]
MNFVHLQIGHVSRSTGRSSVQSVAYITGTKLVEDRRGIIADYRNVRGRNSEEAQEVFYQTLVPEGSGIDPKDLSGIWNKFENYEDEYAALRYKNPETQAQYMANARTAQTYIAALPKELPQEQNIELVREFTKKRFVDQGLVATYAIHWEKGNPHAHIQVSTRTVWNGEISWTKEVSRELASPSGIRETRILFAEIINEYQERAGILHKVDPRSFAERGIDLLPTRHKGYMAHQLEREGKYSRIVADNVQISEENKAKIADNPQIILKELTSKQATFSELDVVRLTQQRLKDDSGILSEYVIDAVMKEAVAVGIGIDNVNRYTSKEYFAKEEKILASLANYGSKQAAIPIDTDMVEQYIDAQSASEDIKFNEGQKNAIRTLCGNNQLSVMVGRAGTGKTTALKAVVDLHLQAGYEVWGMAPSATAAHELWKGAGCTSDTIAHHAYHWHKYHETVDDKDQTSTAADIAKLAKRLPDSKTLILVDEVGMVGVGGWDQEIPGGWDALTKTIDMTGSKLITVLDNHQFKPVDAGDIGRIVVERARAKVDATPLCELVDIIRQHTPWMKEASNQLAQLNTATALEMYDAQGHIQEHKTAIEVYEDMAGQYLRNITRDPSSQGIVLAATNEECQKLNREIRGVLKTNGLLPQEDSLTIGEDGYAVGDKIVFTKNDRNFNTKLTRGPNLGLGSILDQIASLVDGDDSKFFVRNGLQAVIESIKPCRIRDRFAKDDAGKAGFIDTFEIVARVENEDGRPPAEVRHPDKVRFYLHNYREFTHGYAVTGHKSQGMTLDWSLVKLSKFMDAYALYVILTRHRYDTSVYYAKEDFPDFASLIRSVGKVSRKDLAIDYTIPDESKEYWWNVQDYKTLRAEMASIAALGRAAAEQSEREEIWRDYRRTKAEIVDLAKIILGDRDNHRDFIRQAGLTFETLEIAAGLRKRPLSRLEVEACLVVEQYAAAAVESRELWNIIRRTHPGRLAKSHPEWENFEQARDKRGVLANQIAYNPVLYQSFLKETAENLGRQSPTGSTAISYSMRTVQSQAEAHQSKMLQQAMLKETGVDGRHTADPLKHEMLKTLIGYVDARDFSGAIWKELSPKLKEFEGTLLKDSFSKAIDEFTEMRILRDSMAFKIIEKREDYETLALKIGIKLDFEKLADQATQAKRDTLFKAYMAPDSEIEVKLKAAFEINALMQAEGR